MKKTLVVAMVLSAIMATAAFGRSVSKQPTGCTPLGEVSCKEEAPAVGGVCAEVMQSVLRNILPTTADATDRGIEPGSVTITGQANTFNGGYFAIVEYQERVSVPGAAGAPAVLQPQQERIVVVFDVASGTLKTTTYEAADVAGDARAAAANPARQPTSTIYPAITPVVSGGFVVGYTVQTDSPDRTPNAMGRASQTDLYLLGQSTPTKVTNVVAAPANIQITTEGSVRKAFVVVEQANALLTSTDATASPRVVTREAGTLLYVNGKKVTSKPVESGVNGAPFLTGGPIGNSAAAGDCKSACVCGYQYYFALEGDPSTTTTAAGVKSRGTYELKFYAIPTTR